MRLIDAEILLKKAESNKRRNGISAVSKIDILASCIIDAVPVVHAKWVPDREECWLTCSNCNNHVDFLCSEYEPLPDGKLRHIQRYPYYCPYCGAKMGEKENNQ